MDFKNTLLIMTSNVGSSVIEKGGGQLGFQLDVDQVCTAARIVMCSGLWRPHKYLRLLLSLSRCLGRQIEDTAVPAGLLRGPPSQLL